MKILSYDYIFLDGPRTEPNTKFAIILPYFFINFLISQDKFINFDVFFFVSEKSKIAFVFMLAIFEHVENIE